PRRARRVASRSRRADRDGAPVPGWARGNSRSCADAGARWRDRHQHSECHPAAPECGSVIGFLRDRGIEARKWWAGACRRPKQFAACPRASLALTEDLADRVLGLPFFADITDEQLRLVFDGLRAALASRLEPA